MKSNMTWGIMRLVQTVPFLISFIISRVCLRMNETGRNERSNHILNTTGILIVIMGFCLMSAFAFLLVELKKSVHYAKILPIGSLTLSSIFNSVIIFGHPSIRNHVCLIFPFNILSRRFTIRQHRQVGNTEPLHGLKL